MNSRTHELGKSAPLARLVARPCQRSSTIDNEPVRCLSPCRRRTARGQRVQLETHFFTPLSFLSLLYTPTGDVGDEDITVMTSLRRRQYLKEIATPAITFGGWRNRDCHEISRRTVVLCHSTIVNLHVWPQDDGRHERESTSPVTNST
ncbi:hypothetical protein TIFTF001_038648 [Ficus carica]|uniref:Uncharacterized protein n=1 Tax=Ficus carica TaxID=3494 RepID=A0AA88E7M2_FICCA|nr:hypothetical protein TIFTF001_043738 [Ficus carica]GMN23955.1 hypothetical protein TIFTF001_043740 [Ficus carica]GMN69596.1 hypothetical protein TIFTF001_038643 [Ficus carica]GMN69597.1 hypothetical protein TIFTF001_038648 [Ficus carica]